MIQRFSGVRKGQHSQGFMGRKAFVGVDHGCMGGHDYIFSLLSGYRQEPLLLALDGDYGLGGGGIKRAWGMRARRMK